MKQECAVTNNNTIACAIISFTSEIHLTFDVLKRHPLILTVHCKDEFALKMYTSLASLFRNMFIFCCVNKMTRLAAVR